MDTTVTNKFFDQHQSYIEGCLICSDIKSTLKERKMDEGLTVFHRECHEKMEAIAMKLFNDMNAIAKKSKTSGKFLISDITEDQTRIILHSFKRLFSICVFKIEGSGNPDNRVHAFLYDKVYSRKWEITVGWCESSNPFTNPKESMHKSFTVLPAANQSEKLMILWDKAVKNIGCDITVKTRGDCLQAHKFVLMAYSEHFERLFSSSFKETKTLEIKIDADTKIAKAFLEYLYTGQIEANTFTFPELLELFELSHYYGEENLLKTCLYHIEKNSTPEEKCELISSLKKSPYDALNELTLYMCNENASLLASFKHILFGCNQSQFDKFIVLADKNSLNNVLSTLQLYATFDPNLTFRENKISEAL